MKRNVFFIFLWTSLFLTSCSYPHYYYSPNVQNVPLFTEKYEFTGNFAGSLGVVNNSFEAQAGLSLPGHLALTANYMAGGNDNSSVSIKDYSKIQYFEGSAGIYKTFSDIGVFEIYGGYGKGTQHHAFSYNEYDGWFYWNLIPDGTADLSFTKLFIQPDIGVKIKWGEGAFSLRLSRLNYNTIDLYNTVYHLDELNLLKQNNTQWLLEPAFTTRLGIKSVKVHIQVVLAGILQDPELKFEKCRMNFGLYFDLTKKKSQN